MNLTIVTHCFPNLAIICHLIGAIPRLFYVSHNLGHHRIVVRLFHISLLLNITYGTCFVVWCTLQDNIRGDMKR